MFIGLIGTRYAGKTSVVEYLKTRGFTVLKLRSGDGGNDEDTSTAASSDADYHPSRHVTEDMTASVSTGFDGNSNAAGPSTEAMPIPSGSGAKTFDSLADLSGQTPSDEPDALEWMRSRTPESHVYRDEVKDEPYASTSFNPSGSTGAALPPSYALRHPHQHGAGGRHPVVSSLRFNTPSEILVYATKHWRSHFVTEDLPSRHEVLDPFLKRPFFLLVEVDAPLLVRLSRAVDVTLEQLVEEHDILMYGPREVPSVLATSISSHAAAHAAPAAHHALRKLANMTIINSSWTLESFYAYLDSLDLTDPDRLRPRWDTYFMTLASLASQRSNCMKRRVGAILVRNNRILATGYNGTPRGLTNCNEGGCARCNGKAKSGEALDECLCLHAEENALLEAGRERVGDGGGSVLYCNTCPCLRCSVKIVQTGVREVVYNLAYSMDAAAADVFIAAGVTLRQHTP